MLRGRFGKVGRYPAEVREREQEIADLQQAGDPRLTPQDQKILRKLTADDEFGQYMDQLTADDPDVSET